MHWKFSQHMFSSLCVAVASSFFGNAGGAVTE